MRVESWVALAVVWMVVVAGAAASAEGQYRYTLPENIEFTADLDEVVTWMLGRSATFRAQCEQIAGAAELLRVQMRIDTAIPSGYRAFTVMKRRGRQIWADVHLPPSSNLPEIIAHEFEHLLEQIEGLDLKRLAGIPGSGVREVDRIYFETDRADAAGRLVDEEIKRLPAAD